VEDVEPSAEADSQALKDILEKEDEINLRFDTVPAKLRDLKDQNEFEAVNKRFIDNMKQIASELEKIAPNLKAINQLDGVTERLQETNQEFEEARQQAKEANDKYNELKEKRTKKFLEAFNAIKDSIDEIYKNLTKTSDYNGGTAYLSLESSEEPFSHGIKFNAMPPKKRFRDMEQLSGGEKTVAALALLFAINSYKKSPFFVLDEIDAALDSNNVNQVSNYIRGRTDLQCLVISLKDSFYHKSDAIVGIYRNHASECSEVLTVDLTNYELDSGQS